MEWSEDEEALLSAEGIEIPIELTEAGLAKPDDALDAAAAAWSARRHSDGRATSSPGNVDRLEPAIWFQAGSLAGHLR